MGAPVRKSAARIPTPRRAVPTVDSPPVAIDDKTAAVLTGARSVFLAHGFSAATTDMIQRAAGVSKATVYARYATKEALFIAVIEAECERFLDTVRATVIRSRKLREVLEAMAHAYLRAVLSPAALALYRTVVGEAPRFPALARQFYLVGPHGFNAIVERFLTEAADRGELDLSSIGIEMAAIHFVNLVRGEAQMQGLLRPGAASGPNRYDPWVTAAVTTFLRAFATT